MKEYEMEDFITNDS